MNIHDRVNQIPTNNSYEDAEMLIKLYNTGPKLYFPFVVSRFGLIIKNKDSMQVLQRFASDMKNPDFYFPLYQLIMMNSTNQEFFSFLDPLLSTEKLDYIAEFLTLHSESFLCLQDVCLSLFRRIPITKHVILRDNLLLLYLSRGGNLNIVIQCLEMIPVTESADFYREFLVLFASAIRNDSTDIRLINLGLNVSLVVDKAQPLIDILLLSNAKIPSAYLKWIESTQYEIMEFDKERIIECNMESLPPLLRIQLLIPPTESMPVPQYCRTIHKKECNRDEFLKRLSCENNPYNIHDLLIANPMAIPFSEEIPFCYTSLALAVQINTNLTSLYLGKFCKVFPNSQIGVQIAAAKGLYCISLINPNSIPLVLPHIRRLLLHCDSIVRNYLLDALGQATLAGKLDSVIIWKDYQSIRTLTENDLDLTGVLQESILSLNNPNDCELACEILLKIYKFNRPDVESALMRVPISILSRFPQLEALKPRDFPEYSLKNDPLPFLLSDELKKEKTSHRLLLLATCFSLFFDRFEKMDGWSRIIRQTSECVFQMKCDESIVSAIRSILSSPNNDYSHFGALFSLALLFSRKLQSPREYNTILEQIILHSNLSVIRLMALYCLSFSTIEHPAEFVKNIISRRKGSLDDIIGVSYCISSWFASMIPMIKDKTEFKGLSYIWSHINEISSLCGFEPMTRPSDSLGISQYIFLNLDKTDTDSLIEELIGSELTPTTALTSICGFIPSLAFISYDLSFDERQRKIFELCKGPEFEIMKVLLTRPKPIHRTVKVNEKVSQKPTIERLKSDWKHMTSDEISIVLSMLSSNQQDQLIRENKEDWALIIAVHLKNYQAVARMLCSSKRSELVLSKICPFIDSNINEIISNMITISRDMVSISRVLSFLVFKEVISDETSLLLLPWMITSRSFPHPLLDELCTVLKTNHDFRHTLLLTDPKFFVEDTSRYVDIFK